tara:strand:+ start:614 stop:781 length:168 start_codon:yes stop_codon:yes gene_type:complete
MLPHSSLYYDINKEADEVSKGSNNKEYQIITVLAATVDIIYNIDSLIDGLQPIVI